MVLLHNHILGFEDKLPFLYDDTNKNSTVRVGRNTVFETVLDKSNENHRRNLYLFVIHLGFKYHFRMLV